MFEFRGKSGVRHKVHVDDHRLATIVRQCRDLPGHELFQYVDDDGRRRHVGSADVNAYVKEITGEDFTAKDFRTWAGTVLAVTALRSCGPCASHARRKGNVLRAIEAVAGVLGNTRTVCRKSYIHPLVLDAYADGSIDEAARRCDRRRPKRSMGLRVEEAIVVELLDRRRWTASRKRRAA